MIINTTTARTFLEAVHGITNTLDLIQALQGLSRQLDDMALARLAECITGKDVADYDDIKDELATTENKLDEAKKELDEQQDEVNRLEKLQDKEFNAREELQSEFDEYRAKTGHNVDKLNDICANFDTLNYSELRKELTDLQNSFN